MLKEQVIQWTIITVLLLVSSMAFAVEFDSNSANITNRYLPATVGRWGYSLGAGNWAGKVTYFNAVGNEEVSGAQIGAQNFNNVKCLKVNVIQTDLTDSDEFVTIWMAQDTQSNVWILKAYIFFEDETVMLGTGFTSMFMPAVPDVGDPASIIIPETATHYCQVVELDISIDTNFGSYDSCIKIHCFDESTIESVEYYCPDVGEVRASIVGNLQDVMDLKEYGTALDTKAAAQKKAIQAFVTRFYQLCLNRDPDVTGLDGWTNNLLNQTQTGADVAKGFIFSLEFIAKSTTNSQYLEILYKAFFDRNADPAGINIDLKSDPNM